MHMRFCQEQQVPICTKSSIFIIVVTKMTMVMVRARSAGSQQLVMINKKLLRPWIKKMSKKAQAASFPSPSSAVKSSKEYNKEVAREFDILIAYLFL